MGSGTGCRPRGRFRERQGRTGSHGVYGAPGEGGRRPAAEAEAEAAEKPFAVPEGGREGRGERQGFGTRAGSPRAAGGAGAAPGGRQGVGGATEGEDYPAAVQGRHAAPGRSRGVVPAPRPLDGAEGAGPEQHPSHENDCQHRLMSPQGMSGPSGGSRAAGSCACARRKGGRGRGRGRGARSRARRRPGAGATCAARLTGREPPWGASRLRRPPPGTREGPPRWPRRAHVQRCVRRACTAAGSVSRFPRC